MANLDTFESASNELADEDAARDVFLNKATSVVRVILSCVLISICPVFPPAAALAALFVALFVFTKIYNAYTNALDKRFGSPYERQEAHAERLPEEKVTLPEKVASPVPGRAESREPQASPASPWPPERMLRVDDLSDKEALRAALERQAALPRVGGYAQEASRQLDAFLQKRDQALSLLFSNDLVAQPDLLRQLAEAVDGAEPFMWGQARLVATICSSFEGGDYARLGGALADGSYRGDAIDDGVQERRLAAYDAAVARLGDVVNDSERVLLELDRLLAEVVAQLANPAATTSEQVARELRELTSRLGDYYER